VEGLLRDAANVIRIARTFEPVDGDDYGRVLAVAQLPVAMREQPRIWSNLEEARFRRGDVKPPGDKSRGDGHDMSVFQQGMRLK